MKQILLMIAVVALVGCGKKTTPAEPETKAQPVVAAKKPEPPKTEPKAAAKKLIPPKAFQTPPEPRQTFGGSIVFQQLPQRGH